MQGHKLLNRNISVKNRLNLNKIPTGVYLYTITIDGKQKSGKLIKK